MSFCVIQDHNRPYSKIHRDPFSLLDMIASQTYTQIHSQDILQVLAFVILVGFNLISKHYLRWNR